MRFTISKLLFATVVIAVFLGLRNGYVLAATDPASAIDRAWWVPWAMAVMVSAFVCAQCPASTRRRTIIGHAALSGGCAAALAAAILGYEITASLGSYWNWRSDFGYFAIFVIGRALIIGALIGASLGAFWGISAPRRRLTEINDARSK